MMMEKEMTSSAKRFAETAKRLESKIALVDREGSRKMTFVELDRLQRKVAGKLLSMDLQPGAPIMILLDRGSEYIAAYFGILTSGCAAVMTSKEYPQERLDYIRENCGVKLTVTEEFFRDLDAYEPAEIREVPEDTAAHIIYTSGSTGRPKGVLHTVKSLDVVSSSASAFYEIEKEFGEPLVFASSGSFSFAIFYYDVLCPLLSGAELHVLSDHTRKDAKRLSEYYVNHHINAGYIAP